MFHGSNAIFSCCRLYVSEGAAGGRQDNTATGQLHLAKSLFDFKMILLENQSVPYAITRNFVIVGAA